MRENDRGEAVKAVIVLVSSHCAVRSLVALAERGGREGMGGGGGLRRDHSQKGLYNVSSCGVKIRSEDA